MMAMSNKDRARTGGKAVHAGRSPEERSRIAAQVYLTGAVNTVCKRWAELTDAQREKVRHVASS